MIGEKEYVFFASFRSRNTFHDREKYFITRSEFGVKREFMDWVKEQRELLENNLGESVTLLNCNLI